MKPYELVVACIENKAEKGRDSISLIDAGVREAVRDYDRQIDQRIGVKTMIFTSNPSICQSLESKSTSETCLIISDHYGVSEGFVAKMKRRFRFTPAFGLSVRTTEEQGSKWVEEGIVDAFANKSSHPSHIQEIAKRLVAKYLSDPLLSDMRKELLTNTKRDVRYISEGGKVYSPRDLFFEVLQESEIGKCFAERWARSMAI